MKTLVDNYLLGLFIFPVPAPGALTAMAKTLLSCTVRDRGKHLASIDRASPRAGRLVRAQIKEWREGAFSNSDPY